jgi:hypothetical protein
MTAFHPWNGQTNPFIASASAEDTFFAKSDIGKNNNPDSSCDDSNDTHRPT